jgi:hypothetical protein
VSFTKRQTAVFAAVHIFAGYLFLAPSYVRPDSVAIYSWLRSLVVDGDLLFFNEWAGFRMLGDGFAYFKEVTPVAALANHWWVGTSILTAPFYLPSHALSHALPDAQFPADGFFGLDLVTLAWASVLFHGLALGLAFLVFGLIAGRQPSARVFLPALLFTSLGTGAFWETFRMPLGTHAAGMFVVGLFTYLCVRVLKVEQRIVGGADADSRARPVRQFEWSLPLIGFTLGLAAVTRLQHVVLLPAALYVVFRVRRPAREVFLACVGGLIPMVVQGAAWFGVYGTPLGPLQVGANLEGVTWMPFRSFEFLPVLFSSWRGLFVWSPVWAPALVGLLLLARDKDSSFHRDVGVLCLMMFAGELFANSTLDRYWWGGTAFGARRFVDLAVPLAVGLWSFLLRTRIPGLVIGALATAWSCLLMRAVLLGTLDLSRYLSRDDIMRNVVRHWDGLPWGVLHSPVTSWVLAAQSALAILVIGVVAAAIGQLVRIRPRFAVIVSVTWVFVCLITVLLAIAPTRERAHDERARFNLTGEAALSAGPLIDQKGLISDELDWAEATGRADRAARIREEIEHIDQELDRLGVRLRPGG